MPTPGLPQKYGGSVPRHQRYEDVTIYFVGDFMLPRDENGKVLDNDVVIGSDGLGAGSYVMPKIGGAITVPANVAKALIENARMPYPKGHPQWQKSMREGLTYDADYAKLKAESFKSGKPVE